MDEKEFFQTAGGVLQPTKIIIETRNFVTQGMTYATDNITILPLDCSDEVLGSSLIGHLQVSLHTEDGNPDHHGQRKSYLKKAKFKSESAFKKEAKFVTIFRTVDSLCFRPYENNVSGGKWSNFLGLPDEAFELLEIYSEQEVGSALRKAWTKCIFS